MYKAMSACQALHPDPEDIDSEEEEEKYAYEEEEEDDDGKCKDRKVCVCVCACIPAQNLFACIHANSWWISVLREKRKVLYVLSVKLNVH